MNDKLYTDRAAFLPVLEAAFKQAGLKPKAALKKSILKALGERDANAAVCTNKKGEPEHDTDLRDTERIPLDVPIEAYMEKEVWPHVLDAWVNESVTDMTDGETGKVGYEINFNRYFYVYTPPRPLEEIESDILDLQRDINRLMDELFGDRRRRGETIQITDSTTEGYCGGFKVETISRYSKIWEWANYLWMETNLLGRFRQWIELVEHHCSDDATKAKSTSVEKYIGEWGDRF